MYVNRDLFGFTKFETSAKLSREGFEVRELAAAESAVVRAAFHVAMRRPAEATLPGNPPPSVAGQPAPATPVTVRPSVARPAGTQGAPLVVAASGASLEAMEKACGEGAQDACVAVGTALADSGRPGSMARARQVLKKSCDAGSTNACRVLGQLPPG